MKLVFIYSSLGDHVATVSVFKGDDIAIERIRDSKASRAFLEECRQSDFEEHGVIAAYYPRSGLTTLLNFNLGAFKMDILSKIQTASSEAKLNEEGTEVLIAPSMDVMPSDGAVQYKEVVNASDLVDLSSSTVLLFKNDGRGEALLKMFVENAHIFGAVPVVLRGLPRAEYTVQFDAICHALRSVSYVAFIDDLVQRKRIVEGAKPKSVYEGEKRQRTTSRGTVRPFTAFDVARINPDAGVEDDIASDE